MKHLVLSLLILGQLCGTGISSATGEATPSSKPKQFLVFDATLYANKPDLSPHGIQPIPLVYAGKFGPHWQKQENRLPDIDSVKAAAREAKMKSATVVIDIEHWPLKGSPESVKESLRKYITVMEWFREGAPGIILGYYGAPPIRDYWRAIKPPSSPERHAWMSDNDEIRPLARAVDVFFPSLYTFYPDQNGWKQYAIAQIEEARRYGSGKPVYVFIWPQYHDSNRILGGQYLPADYWQLELETARQYADGIVIWGGWGSGNRPAQWDEQAPWWLRTKEFMKTLDAAAPVSSQQLPQ